MTEKLLKNTLFGYSKKSVHAYLEAYSAETENEANKNRSILQQNAEQKEKLMEQISSKEAEIKALQQKLQQEGEALLHERDEIEKAGRKYEALSTQYNFLSQENETLKQQVGSLDEERDLISATLLIAQREAVQIRRAAHEAAEELKSQKEREAQSLLQEAQKAAEQSRLAQEEESAAKKADLERELAVMQSNIDILSKEMKSLKENALSAMKKYTSELDYLITEYKV